MLVAVHARGPAEEACEQPSRAQKAGQAAACVSCPAVRHVASLYERWQLGSLLPCSALLHTDMQTIKA